MVGSNTSITSSNKILVLLVISNNSITSNNLLVVVGSITSITSNNGNTCYAVVPGSRKHTHNTTNFLAPDFSSSSSSFSIA